MEKLIEAMSGPYGDVISMMKTWYEVSVLYVQMEAELNLTIMVWAVAGCASLFLVSSVLAILVLKIDYEKRLPDRIVTPAILAAVISGAVTLILIIILACDYAEMKTTAKHPEKKAIEQIISKIRS